MIRIKIQGQVFVLLKNRIVGDRGEERGEKKEMKGEGKGWHFRRGKGMEENTRDRQEVGDIKKFFLELSLTHTHITHLWQGYLTIK